MRYFALLAAVTAAVALASCATKRAPEPASSPDASSGLQPQRPNGPAPGSAEDFRVNVGDRIFFGLDRSDLTSEARATLERQAAWLRRYSSAQLLVAGNCDERGTREYNVALGARRAAAARDYLISLGVAGDRIDTVSYGKERPLDPRSNEEAWAVNRNAHANVVSGAVS
jgi:peptidoglycan-associated lipoprotein